MLDLDTLVAGYRDALDGLEAVVADLDAAAWDRPTGCPGWDVHDQVAHVVSLEGLLAGEPLPDHRLDADPPHVRDDVGRFMEVLVDVRRGVPPAELVAELREVFARRRAWLEGVDDLEATGPSLFGGEQPLYRSLPVRVVDLYAHGQDVRRATHRYGHHDGPAAAVTADRLAKGLARILPRRVPREATVVVEVDGAHGRTIAVDLAAGPLEVAPDAPSLRLRLPFADFVALACGRRDGPGIDAVELAGDRALAKQVLAAAALTP